MVDQTGTWEHDAGAIASNQAGLPSPLNFLKASKGISDVYASHPMDIGPDNVLASFNQLTKHSQYDESPMMRGLSFSRIKQADWDQYYPYRFIIFKIETSGSGRSTSLNLTQYYQVVSLPLLIGPQELTVTTPFAIKTTVTSRGILEEHNGIPIKQITFSGTTGIYFNRPAPLGRQQPTAIQTLFAGTIEAVGGLVSQVNNLISGSVISKPKTKESLEYFYTGYYQYHILNAFLEAYAQLKKSINARDYRLAISLGKDQEIYLVSPQTFVKKKSISSPMEIQYTFNALAWATVPYTSIINPGMMAVSRQLQKISGSDINDLQKALNTIRNLRGTIESAKNIVKALKTDIEVNVMGPIRSIILALKELTSVPQTLADFPKELQKAFQSTIVQNAGSIGPGVPLQYQGAFKAATNPSTIFSSPNPDPGAQPNAEAPTNPEVLGQDGIMDSIDLAAIPLTPEQEDAADAAYDTAANLNNNDVTALISQLSSLETSLSPLALEQGVESSLWDVLYSINDSKTSLYSLLSDNLFGTQTTSEQGTVPDPIEAHYQSLADANDINFQSHPSKLAVPFPFGVTLEWLSQTYLGDASRWMEIVSANNLQPPYIDEDGFTYYLTSNASGTQFTVESVENLFVGQKIFLSSSTQIQVVKKIQAIQQVTETSYIISVVGITPLNAFKLADDAYMRAYLPNTINSQQMIYIPVDTPSDMDPTQTKNIAYIQEDPQLLRLSKIDVMLDQYGDLAITNEGFLNLAYGKANLIQAAKIKMQTAVGKLLLHPSFGGGVEPGEMTSDLNIDQIKESIINSFVSDPRFSAVNYLQINQTEDAMTINMEVEVANNGGILPLSFRLRG